MGKETITINFEWFEDLLISLWVLINPKYWIMNYPYSEEWDIELNRLMDEHTFIIVDRFTAKLGDRLIWITNYPYASFRDYTMRTSTYGRSSRKTIFRAMKKLNRDKLIEREITTNPPMEIPLQGEDPLYVRGGEGMLMQSSVTINFTTGETESTLTEVKTIHGNGIPSHWDEIDN